MRKTLDRGLSRLGRACANPYVVILALSSSFVWLAFGPYFQWSTAYFAWMMNTTTLITFDLAFVLIYTGYKDVMAMQIKADETLRSIEQARNDLIGVEDMDSDDIEREAAKLRSERPT